MTQEDYDNRLKELTSEVTDVFDAYQEMIDEDGLNNYFKRIK